MSIHRETFYLGQMVATPGALEALAQNKQQPFPFFWRHAACDWGEVDAEDQTENDRAVKNGNRILSAYRLEDGEKIWIITEGDRSATTLLLPEEY